MDDNRQQEYERAFSVLKHAYIRRLYNTVRIIDNILILEKVVPLSRNDLLRTQSLVHGLAGSGATFGFPAVTEAGLQADYFLEKFLKTDDAAEPMNDTQRQELLHLLSNAQKVCQDVYNRARREIPDLENPSFHVAPERQNPVRILIIEDGAEISSVMAMALKTADMTMQKMDSGADALHDLSRMRPDLVLLDMNLTDMSGMEVLQQIKQNSEFLDIPVIVLATRHNEGEEDFIMKAGAAAYIRKPVNIEPLVDTVKQIVSGAEARRIQSI